jgi:UDP-N-acetylmuramate dehydrogenase
MTIQNNISLKPHNTFGIDVNCKYFVEYTKPSDIEEIISFNKLKNNHNTIILGGGSNHLFTKDFDGLVIHPTNNKISIAEENNDYIFIKADAGLDWDYFVEYTVKNNWGGIENLSYIPGCIGASPVQNIGAYGVEAKDCIHQVNVVDMKNGSTQTLDNNECEFGYRTSIFKNKFKNKFIVDSVVFKLSKKPVYITHYGTIQDELNHKDTVNLKTIRDTIIKIREEKLPDYKKLGNGGSFFKNPIINNKTADKLLLKYPNMPIYNATDNTKKLAAGWLIEQCGLKGYSNKKNSAGVHNKQALVIVNKGNATGKDILNLSKHIQKQVFDKFMIQLEPEVIIL